jgi:hypothetical protein
VVRSADVGFRPPVLLEELHQILALHRRMIQLMSCIVNPIGQVVTGWTRGKMMACPSDSSGLVIRNGP